MMTLFNYNLYEIVTYSAVKPCGVPVVEFMYSDGRPLDMNVFIDDRSTIGDYKFGVDTSDISFAGDHELVFTFYLS